MMIWSSTTITGTALWLVNFIISSLAALSSATLNSVTSRFLLERYSFAWWQWGQVGSEYILMFDMVYTPLIFTCFQLMIHSFFFRFTKHTLDLFPLYPWIDIARATALGCITGGINKGAIFLTGWTFIRRSFCFKCIPAFWTFKPGHDTISFLAFHFVFVNVFLCNNHKIVGTVPSPKHFWFIHCFPSKAVA